MVDPSTINRMLLTGYHGWFAICRRPSPDSPLATSHPCLALILLSPLSEQAVWNCKEIRSHGLPVCAPVMLCGCSQCATIRGQAPLTLPKWRVSLGNPEPAGSGQTAWQA